MCLVPRPEFDLYLASTSPRRRELLRRAGFVFALCEPGAEYVGDRDEHGAEVGDPAALAQERAQRKATGARPPERNVPVLGVDTVVDVDGLELGKPRDRADAERMLQQLLGREHRVHTAHYLVVPATGRALAALATAAVVCGMPGKAELEHYLDSHEWGGKAGGYGIQDGAQTFFSVARGSKDTVIGLHVAAVADLLARVRAGS
ncbi:MAG: Maf family protein [Planctomycetota bacterium]